VTFPFVKYALKHVFSKPSTENFPKVIKEAPANYRGRIVFHPERCNGCGMCMRVCAPDAISKTVEKTTEGDLITMEFNLSSCTFCQTCVDFCPRKSVEMSKDYAMVARHEDELKVKGTFLKKPPQKPPPKKGANSPEAEECT